MLTHYLAVSQNKYRQKISLLKAGWGVALGQLSRGVPEGVYPEFPSIDTKAMPSVVPHILIWMWSCLQAQELRVQKPIFENAATAVGAA